MLTDPELCPILESKIETEVLARLSTKSRNGSPILGTLVTPSKQQKILDQIGEAEKVLSKCTTLVEQLKQQTMTVKEDIIEALQCTINSAKKRPASSKTNLYDEESDESDEDLNRKPAYKPNSKKHNNFSKDDSTAYMKNEIMKLSNHSWKYDTNFPQCLMNNNESFRKIPNAIMCIHALYRSMVPDEEEEEQNVEKITKIAETHTDVVTTEMGLDYFMTKFPNMKKLDIDLCGLITSQPGEGTFKHNPYNNAIAVFLLKGPVKRFHYVLVINKDIIKGINNFKFQLKYYTDGFRCNTEFFPQYVGICHREL
eukprot:jgi/Psemu1/45128/gm1.45128_g